MQPHTERLIRDTWGALRPTRMQAAALFYERLFAVDPSLRALFDERSMVVQYEKFVHTVDTLVQSLDYQPTVIEDLQALAHRHVGYGVLLTHYDTVGAALLWAVAHELGERWTPDVERAWTELYGWIAGVMRRAAQGHGSGRST